MGFELAQNTDLATLINDLREAEEDGRRNPETRALLNRASVMLTDCQREMASAVENIELALSLRAGFMDSDRRHTEISNAKNQAMQQAATSFRTLLTKAGG